MNSVLYTIKISHHSHIFNYFFQNIIVTKEESLKLKKKNKQSNSECSSEIDSDSSEDIEEIEDCLYIDDEDIDNFISKDINEKTLQEFLKREMNFYAKAFPQDILTRKSPGCVSTQKHFK